jgi:hypothetical protein
MKKYIFQENKFMEGLKKELPGLANRAVVLQTKWFRCVVI